MEWNMLYILCNITTCKMNNAVAYNFNCRYPATMYIILFIWKINCKGFENVILGMAISSKYNWLQQKRHSYQDKTLYSST